MIATAAAPRDPRGIEARLLAALAARGVRHLEASAIGSEPVVWLVSDGFAADPLEVIARTRRESSTDRILVLSRLRAHPDGPTDGLRRLWDLEERARRGPLTVLTLRLGPVVGPESPLWQRLASSPQLPRDGRTLLHPVVEDDVVETVARALRDADDWADWFEVAGPEILSLAELSALAAEWGTSDPAAAWEPPLEEIVHHRLVDPRPWLERYGLAPAPLAERVRAWSTLRSAS